MEIDAEELLKQLKEDVKEKTFVNAEILAFREKEDLDSVQVLSAYDFDDNEELATDVHIAVIKALYQLAVAREEALLETIEKEDEELKDLVEKDLNKFKKSILKGETKDD